MKETKTKETKTPRRRKTSIRLALVRLNDVDSNLNKKDSATKGMTAGQLQGYLVRAGISNFP